ncbi:MAG: hypothetical protein RLZZ488_159 [Pseudomonadota bacterium]
MDRLWVILRRLIFLFVAVFISANAIAYLILNNPFVHDWFRRQANATLEKAGLEVFIGPISLNFLETKLTITQIKLSQADESKKDFAAIGSFVVAFDPWRLGANGAPAVKFVSIEDWQLDVDVIEKFSQKNDSMQKRESSFSHLFGIAKAYVGRQIELKNGRILKDKNSLRVADLSLQRVFAKFSNSYSGDSLTLLAEAGQSQVCLSESLPCKNTLQITGASVNIEINSDGTARVGRADVRSSLGDWQVSGQVRFGERVLVENYNLKLEGASDATAWFNIVDMQGRGRFKTSVYLNPEGSAVTEGQMQRLLPSIHGQVSWDSLHLAGYDIYSGRADVQYSSNNISYKNAQIRTPSGAEIESFGEFSLSESMPYMNTARIKNFPFSELMAGIDVPTDAVHFDMNTNELLVGGLMNADAQKKFTLVISGAVDVTRMKVPSFEPNPRPMPDCLVNLRIDSDSNHMSFARSSAACGMPDEEKLSEIDLGKGLIDYNKSVNDFRFHMRRGPAEIISYFVKEDIAGELNMQATIFASPSSPVKFKADAQINDASVFELNVPRIGGEISIDAVGLRARNVEGWLDIDEQRPSVIAKNFYLGFQNDRLEIDGSIDGELSYVLRAFGKKGRELAQHTRGILQVPQLKLRGTTRNLLKSNFDIRLRINRLQHPMLSAADVQAAFYCQQGWCSGSRLFMQDIALGETVPKAVTTSGGSARSGFSFSKAILEIDSISEKSLSARLDVQSVPLKIRYDEKQMVSGTLDLRASLQGGLRDWEVSGNGRFDNLSVGRTSFGSLSFNALSHSGGPLNINLTGLYDQVQARVIFDHDFEKSTQIFTSLRSFEVFKYLPFQNQGALRVSGLLSSNLSVSAPGLKTILRSGNSVLQELNGSGQLDQIRVQLGSESFVLAEPVRLSMDDGVVSLSGFKLVGSSSNMTGSAQYELASSHFNGRVDGQIDAAIFSQLTDFISQSSGTVLVNSRFEKNEDGTSVSGEARVDNVTLGGKYLSPPLTALNGRLVFEDSRIEIPALNGAKGNGQVDIAGSVEFASDSIESQITPNISLRTNLRGAQFRWPQDFFETVDTTIDGQIEVSGSAQPYLISGDVRITKGRAYRDATCQEMIGSGTSGSDASIAKPQKPSVNLNMNIEADNSFTLQSNCIRGRISTGLRLSGTNIEPILAGQMRLDNGVLNLLKTRFEVTRADATFDNIVKIEPRLDAQMVAKIDKYSVFVGAEGPLSKPRLNIWSDPSTGPDGNPLSRPALIRMISTGRGPAETTQTAVTQALANQVVGLFDDPLSQAVSKITRGFVDRFELQPIVEGGQSSFRARASRDLGEKFNLGLDYEPNRQSLTGTIFINESVNVLGGFDRRSSQIGSYSELSGGIRFQFGGK